MERTEATINFKLTIILFDKMYYELDRCHQLIDVQMHQLLQTFYLGNILLKLSTRTIEKKLVTPSYPVVFNSEILLDLLAFIIILLTLELIAFQYDSRAAV